MLPMGRSDLVLDDVPTPCRRSTRRYLENLGPAERRLPMTAASGPPNSLTWTSRSASGILRCTGSLAALQAVAGVELHDDVSRRVVEEDLSGGRVGRACGKVAGVGVVAHAHAQLLAVADSR